MPLESTGSSYNAQRLERARRNLILISTLLAFIQTTGARLSGVSFQGAALIFEREDAVFLWLWILMIYFWVRYFQHFIDYAPSPLTSLYWGLVHKDAVTIATKKALEEIRGKYLEYADMDVEPLLSLRQTKDLASGLPIPWALVKHGFIFDVVRIHVRERGREQIKITETQPVDFIVRVPDREMLYSKVIHAISLGWSRTVFTEYIFPMLLPFVPIAIQIYSTYQ